MKKITVILVIFVTCLLLLGTQHFLSMDNQGTNVKIENKRVKISETKYKANSIKSQNTLNIESALPKECESFLIEMIELNQNELKTALVDKSLVMDMTCYNALKSYLNLKGIDFNCSSINENCLSHLSFVKAFKIAENIFHLDMNSLTDSELAAKIVSLFFNFKDEMSKDQIEQNLKYFKEFHERFPTDNRVIEAYVGYMIISSQILRDKQMNLQIDDLLESSSSDFKLDRLRLVQQVINKNDSLAHEILLKLEAQYPGEPEIQYYLAAKQWKLKNKAQTLEHLDLAISLAKKGCSYCTPEVYLDTKKAVEKASLGDEKLFSFTLGLNFSDF
jgi:hypothetical protein